MFRSSPPEEFFKKDDPQIWSKFTGEPCRSVISTKVLCNFVEITPTHGCILGNSQYTYKTSLGDCFCMEKSFTDLVIKIITMAAVIITTFIIKLVKNAKIICYYLTWHRNEWVCQENIYFLAIIPELTFAKNKKGK